MVAVNDLIDFGFEVFSGHRKISSSGSPSQQGEILRQKREYRRVGEHSGGTSWIMERQRDSPATRRAKPTRPHLAEIASQSFESPLA